MSRSNACLFEISWEVCNKVGGIYTVISSKAPQAMKNYKQVYFVGPYIPQKAAVHFQELMVPAHLKSAFEALKSEGIVCHYGKWMIQGKPKAILVDASAFSSNLDGIKQHLWETYQVDSLYASPEFDEPVAWSWAVGKLLEQMSGTENCPKTVMQAHEWLSGAALLYCKDKKLPVATVFTTHATMLGRTVAGSNQPLYDILDQINPDEEAKKHGIQEKHSMEKASAQHADIFTTVSKITALEATHLLGRKPDVVLPNGLDFDRFPDLEQIPRGHEKYKQKIKQFLHPFFSPYYELDLDNTLLFYLSGRYEMRNKGIDITIDALGNLNEALKKKKNSKTVVMFIFVPVGWSSIKGGFLQSKSLFDDMNHQIDDYMNVLRAKILKSLSQRHLPKGRCLLDEDFLFEMKKDLLSLRREGAVPMSTHDFGEEPEILRRLREKGLDNSAEQKVKVILYPGYLSSSDGLMDLDYYHAVHGCHLGIFPSYYEPWGYTPLESAALGVPAITTDLAGFGIYVDEQKEKNPGIYVLKRKDRSYDQIVKDLSAMMIHYASLSKHKRIHQKVLAEHFAPQLAWSNLFDHYLDAHGQAMAKAFGK